MSNDYEPDRSRLPKDVCENLCTKTMYMASSGSPDVYEEEPGISTASFWCVFTQTPFGEDGQEVSPQACRPGRACCSPRFSFLA
jgi:hypothetical protein